VRVADVEIQSSFCRVSGSWDEGVGGGDEIVGEWRAREKSPGKGREHLTFRRARTPALNGGRRELRGSKCEKAK
jgi:hypothetical protein